MFVVALWSFEMSNIFHFLAKFFSHFFKNENLFFLQNFMKFSIQLQNGEYSFSLTAIIQIN